MSDGLPAAIAQQEARKVARPAAEAVARTVAADVATTVATDVATRTAAETAGAYVAAHPAPRGIRGEPGDPGDQGEPGLEWQGDWRASATYDPGDCVAFEGSSYVAVEASTNDEPPDGPWDLLAKKGDPGPAGARGGGGGGGSGSGLPPGGTVGQVVTNTAPGTGTWQDASGGAITKAAYIIPETATPEAIVNALLAAGLLTPGLDPLTATAEAIVNALIAAGLMEAS